MIRIFLLVFALVVATTLVLDVPAGWAWIIVLAGIAAFLVWQHKKRADVRWVTLSAIWKCPYCLTPKPLGATVCRYCGSALLVHAADTEEQAEQLEPLADDERRLIAGLLDTVDSVTRSLSHVGRSLRLMSQRDEPPRPPLELLPPPSSEEDPATHDPPLP